MVSSVDLENEQFLSGRKGGSKRNVAQLEVPEVAGYDSLAAAAVILQVTEA